MFGGIALELLLGSPGRPSRLRDRAESIQHGAEWSKRREPVVGDESCRGDELSPGKATGSGLLLIDLDNFKAVNDLGGHETGDKMLAEVAQAIRSRVRMTDHAYRIGGDEFAVLLPHATEESALPLVDSLRDAIRGIAIHHAALTFTIDASIGAATIAPGTAKSAMTSADRALYEDKTAHLL